MHELTILLIGGAKFGMIYALGALGLVVVHRATRTVNFAHGGFVLIGAFASFLVLVEWKLPPWTAYFIAPVIVGVVAMAMEYFILRPLRQQDTFSVIIATVFLGITISEGYRIAYNTELVSVPRIWPVEPFRFGSVFISVETAWTIFGILAMSIATILFLERARFSKGMRAMASNLRGAQLSGYSVTVVYAAAWFIAGALAGLTGVFVAPISGISPDLAIIIIASSFVAAVIGGFDSMRGAILGGLILGISETLAAAYLSSAFKSAISFIILFAILLVRPEGLFSSAKARNV